LSGNVLIGPLALLPCRADALGFGVLVTLACRNEKAWTWLNSHRSYILAAFLLFGCGVPFMLKYQRYVAIAGYTWLDAFYALLLLLAIVNPGRIVKTCFRSWLLVKLGMVSYAVYIFHEGINALFQYVIVGSQMHINHSLTLSVTFLSLAAVLLLAAASWRFMERPILRYAHAAFQYVPAAARD
jgi:peptidoglycan/LPS O-acetylase OafA/YrhL